MAKSKVLIIDIDLGIDIDRVIAEDVAELTGNSKVILEKAIDGQRHLQQLKQRRLDEKLADEKASREALQTGYDLLLTAGPDGVSATKLADAIAPNIPTLSAFTLKLKTYLKNQGNHHTVVRTGSGNRAKYMLVSPAVS